MRQFAELGEFVRVGVVGLGSGVHGFMFGCLEHYRQKKALLAQGFPEARHDYFFVPITSISTRRSGCRHSMSALVLLVALALVAGDGLLLALAFGVDAVGFDALAHQVVLDRSGALLGELLVVRVGADAVGVADGDDHFELDALGFGGEIVERLLAFGAQRGLVEVEQRVGGERDLLGGGLRRRGGGGGRRRPGAAFFTRSGSHSAMAMAGVQ